MTRANATCFHTAVAHGETQQNRLLAGAGRAESAGDPKAMDRDLVSSPAPAVPTKVSQTKPIVSSPEVKLAAETPKAKPKDDNRDRSAVYEVSDRGFVGISVAGTVLFAIGFILFF